MLPMQSFTKSNVYPNNPRSVLINSSIYDGNHGQNFAIQNSSSRNLYTNKYQGGIMSSSVYIPPIISRSQNVYPNTIFK